MPYTLVIGIVWVLLAMLLGGIIGYLLRSVTARRQVARARAAAGAVTGIVAPSAVGGSSAAVADEPAPESSIDDLEADPVSEFLGRKVVVDDLTVIEGIGPNVESLCHGIGIFTWRDLADTEVSLLRTMLEDAGSRVQLTDPDTWPEQARLLADGQWTEFVELASSVRASRGGS